MQRMPHIRGHARRTRETPSWRQCVRLRCCVSHGKVVTRKNRGEVASPAAALFTADSGSSVVALQWHTFTLLLIYELPLPCASHGSAWCRSVACVAPLSRPEVVDDTAS